MNPPCKRGFFFLYARLDFCMFTKGHIFNPNLRFMFNHIQLYII